MNSSFPLEQICTYEQFVYQEKKCLTQIISFSPVHIIVKIVERASTVCLIEHIED